MSASAAAALIADLRARVGALERPRGGGVLPFGVAALDAALPRGGLALGGAHELLEGGIGPARDLVPSATRFAAAIAARLEGLVLWISPARDLFAPGLAGLGLGPERLLIAEAASARGVLPLVEEAVRSSALAAVVAETARVGMAASRRFQLAAEASGVTLLMLRRWAAEEEPTAAISRWRIGPAPSPSLGLPGVARARLAVELLRVRGGEPARFILEAPDAQGRLALPADLADRPLEEAPSRAAA